MLRIPRNPDLIPATQPRRHPEAPRTSPLARANAVSKEVAVFLGNGFGSLGEPVTTVLGENAPEDLTIGDVNGDGNLDVVTANTSRHSVTVLFGQGDGSLPRQVVYRLASASPQRVLLADTNSDGIDDIVTANLYRSNVSILVGAANGSFAAPTETPIYAADNISPFGYASSSRAARKLSTTC